MSSMMRNTTADTGITASESADARLDNHLSDKKTVSATNDIPQTRTAIEECVQAEVRRYLDMLDGEEPGNLYRMVIRQTESAVIDLVMSECRGNQTRASEWLGISRGNLRTKLAGMNKL